MGEPMTRTFVDGRVHVRKTMCETCIFRLPLGNLMHLEPGRVEQMVADATADDAGSIPCHSHLYRDAPVEPVCRGFFDQHSTFALRLAVVLGVITYVGDD